LDLTLAFPPPGHGDHRYTEERPVNGMTFLVGKRFTIETGPSPPSARHSTINASTAGDIWCGHDDGRDGAHPPSR
jgi:hypothetical protein